MKRILAGLAFIVATLAVNAQEKVVTETQAPARWAIINNPGLKGANGVLTINLPVQSGMQLSIAKAGDAKILFNWHGSTTKELPPGYYDITFWGIKIPSVAVEKGRETRIFAGVLNSTVKKPWEIWTATGEKVYAGGGTKMVALPVGKYIMKTSGTELKQPLTTGR